MLITLLFFLLLSKHLYMSKKKYITIKVLGVNSIMKDIEKKVLEQLNEYDSMSLGYLRNNGDKIEIGLTSYIDIDFVGDLYTFIKNLLYPYKTQSVNVTIVDVEDGDKNPLDAIISIEI